VLDEDVLGGAGTALHAIDDHHVGAGGNRELHVVGDPGGSHLDEDRLLPVGGLPQLGNLDAEVVRTRPVGVSGRGALVDAGRECSHGRDPFADLLPEQHPTAAWLCALTDDHLDRVGPVHVGGVETVARRQALVDERLRGRALLRRHPAVAGGRRGADRCRGSPQRLFGMGGQGAEAHAGDRDRDIEHERLLGVPAPEHGGRVATLPVALERVARRRSCQERQVVEVGHAALRAPASNLVAPVLGHELDLVDHLRWERRAGAKRVVGPRAGGPVAVRRVDAVGAGNLVGAGERTHPVSTSVPSARRSCTAASRTRPW
jgi:hypothetical protein